MGPGQVGVSWHGTCYFPRKMRLLNHTAIPAAVSTAELEGSTRRLGLLTAKATFRFDGNGRVELETQSPLPLFIQDEKTPLGDLPSDMQPRADEAFEVILLGHAWAPTGRQVAALTVALGVGQTRREMLVFGDRFWSAQRRAILPARPFNKMPLDYARAFGGTVSVHLDRESVFDLADPLNRHGKGFDAERIARDMGAWLKAPSGFPRLPDGYVRALPNLEDRAAPIARWEDVPPPMCWATVPVDVPLWSDRMSKKLAAAPEVKLPKVVGYRAHPDWVIPTPATAPRLRLENLVEARPVLELQVPDFGVVADYTINRRLGTRSLLPHTLLLLPDQGRFTVTYRLPFNFQFEPDDEREFRLRLAAKWHAPTKEPS
jgi:hypothetical protein